MPRRRINRRVLAPPGFKGYRPYGCKKHPLSSVELLYEEYEAIKLADYDSLHHHEASKLMGISRPTFARIYDSARRKIAQALVETKEIKTSYGNAVFDDNWYICIDCSARFTIPTKKMNMQCAICGTTNIQSLSSENL
ncbi:DUF134 domain-containing protein [Bacteroidota bacterium]